MLRSKKLFKVFSQADSSITRKFGGTGLGLVISDMIAGKMGSKINVRSTVDVGTTFFFDIITAVEFNKKLDTTQIENIKNCLIIDDNANNCLILEHMLQKWQIVCESYYNGIDALKRLETSHSFDVIICDYNMPYMNGLEIIRVIREKLNWDSPKQPIILLHSSSENTEIYQKCKEWGVCFLLNKPVKSNDLFSYLCNLHKPEAKTITAADPKQASSSSDFGNSSKKVKILIAEDISMNMKLIKAMLPKIVKNVEIIEAKNGQQAVEYYISSKPDLILMDVQMPVLDGLKAAKQIRELEKDQDNHIPIIALTAGALKEEMEKCYASGMNDFLTKPIDPKKIKRILDKHLIDIKKDSITLPEINIDNETHFEYSKLAKILDHNKEIIKELILAAKKYIPVEIEELNQAYNERNPQKINAIAHSIKGACLSIHFKLMSVIAEKIEISSDDNRLDDIENMLSKLREEWDIVENILTQTLINI